MTWAKIDDRLHSHPKARRAGLEAMGLWVLCLSFCGAYNTDGRIGRADVEGIGGRRGLVLADKLVAAGLWMPTDDGWSFHDFLAYNPSAEAVATERARKAEAGKRGGLAKAAARAASASTSLAPASPLLPEPAVLPIPTRPDPGSDPPVGPPEGGGSSGRARGRRDKPDPLREAFAAGIRDGAPGVEFVLPPGKLGGLLGPVLQAYVPGADGSEAYAWLTATVARWRRSADPEYAGGWSPRAFVTALNRDPSLGRTETSPESASPGHVYTPPPEVDPVQAAANRRAAAEAGDLFKNIGLGGAL